MEHQKPIKFRGKRIDDNKWVYGSGIKVNRSGTIIIYDEVSCRWHEVDPKTVGQFTGVYDSTKWDELSEDEKQFWKERGYTKDNWQGKEIYEGDIVCCEPMFSIRYKYNFKVEKFISRVYFAGGSFRVRYQTFENFLLSDMLRVKIQGNVYDNPELLKGGLNAQWC